jgi:tetratricopeptide (TPR) repeat protein
MNRSLKTALYLVSLITFSCTVNADAFSQAIAAYEDSDYTAAIELFESDVATTETAAARHNLALSYFQNANPAEAAWQIERAIKLAPLNTEYRYKLGALRQQIGLFDSRPDWYIVGAQFLTTKAWIAVACISFWLLLAACALPRIGGIPANLSIHTTRALCVCLLAIALPALWLNHGLDQAGIVVSNTPSDLHAAPASAAPTSGIARPGERARIIDQHNEFYQVETEGQATGWISKEAFRALAI